MRRIILTVIIVSSILPVFSQNGASIIRPTGATNGTLPIQLNPSAMSNILNDPYRGQNFNINDRMGDVEGTPLLYADWKSGEVTLRNNEKYQVRKINLDASRNKFIYSVNDTLYEFLDNVSQIKIYDNSNPDNPNSTMIFKNTIDPESDNFVQLLDTGKITIFQTYTKKPEGENYTNGIVNNIRKYVLHTTQYAIVNKTVIPIKFSSSTLDDLTADKRKQVEVFVKENKLKVKSEPDFLKAISFYNSIGG